LYIEKRAKDLLDTLDLDPDMDTRDIVIYFAQFDDYLQILEKWESGEWAKDAPLIQEDIVDTIAQEDSLEDDLDPSDTDRFTPPTDDNTLPQTTSWAASELIESSDW